jgi:hypothetical protein
MPPWRQPNARPHGGGADCPTAGPRYPWQEAVPERLVAMVSTAFLIWLTCRYRRNAHHAVRKPISTAPAAMMILGGFNGHT